MWPHKVLLSSIAVLMIVFSIAIFRKQATAKSCPVHNSMAGRLAVLLGWVLLFGGVGLLAFVSANIVSEFSSGN